MYENFLSDFEHRINALSLGEMVLIIVKQISGMSGQELGVYEHTMPS